MMNELYAGPCSKRYARVVDPEIVENEKFIFKNSICNSQRKLFAHNSQKNILNLNK